MTNIWYAVETAFVDGKFLDSKCVFTEGDSSPVGHCYAGLNEEPMNSCEKKFDDRIEIHVDWFESEKLAEDFCGGKITYIHHYDAYYKKSIKSTLRQFTKREIINVDEQNGIFPYKGIYKEHMLDSTPYWCK